jgi:hypothetical protein
MPSAQSQHVHVEIEHWQDAPCVVQKLFCVLAFLCAQVTFVVVFGIKNGTHSSLLCVPMSANHEDETKTTVIMPLLDNAQFYSVTSVLECIKHSTGQFCDLNHPVWAQVWNVVTVIVLCTITNCLLFLTAFPCSVFVGLDVGE